MLISRDPTCVNPHTARRRRTGFSLVELMIVIAIMVILIGLVTLGGAAITKRAKTRDTQGLIEQLNMAIEAYRGDVQRIGNGSGAAIYAANVPPDELGVFQAGGMSISGCPVVMSHAGAFVLQPTDVQNPPLQDQRDFSTGQLTTADPSALFHGDIRAMVLAMRLRSPKASAILDRIDSRFKASGAAEERYYDPEDGSALIPLDYYVDAWGNALEFYSMCPCEIDTPTARQKVSGALVMLNNGEPVLVSYGPNGSEQLAADTMQSIGDTTIVADFLDPTDTVPSVNEELNQDNVYSSDMLKDRLFKGGS